MLTSAQGNAAIKWIFVFGHHPGHSEIWPDGNLPWAQEKVIPLLGRYPKVEAYVYGHSHNYERGAWFQGNLRLLLTGGGGGDLDRWGMYPNQQDYPEIQRAYDYYTYSLFDIDVGAGTYSVRSYGLGHKDKSMSNVLIDSWSRRVSSSGPRTPSLLGSSGSRPACLTASPFVSDTAIMSSQFQVTATRGDYSSPLLDRQRDWENIYGIGVNYAPIDKNRGVDLSRYCDSTGTLLAGRTYHGRVRYRDQFMQWSPWSPEFTFLPATAQDSADFTADSLLVRAGSQVRFTDLSANRPTAWEWDLDGDGAVDSRSRDPVWLYPKGGTYSVTLTTLYGTTRRSTTKAGYIRVQGSLMSRNARPNRLQLSRSRFSPDPFRSTTILRLELDAPEEVRIDFFSVQGRKVRTLTDGWLPSGLNFLTWDGKDGEGRLLPNGKYFYRISSASWTSTREVFFLH